MAHHVIILGCGRSGTSIFGELFEQLVPFTYYSEPPFATLTTLNYTSPVAVKVPKESTGFPPTAGLSFPLETLLAIIPEPRKIYWQLRHPLDTICSLRVGIAKNWGHHPRPPDWQDWLKRPLPERCAHHWDYINSIGYAQVSNLSTITRFENMIENPLRFAQQICQEIEIDPTVHKLSLETWAQRVQNTNNHQFIEAKTSREYSRLDHTTKIDRWKENLSTEEVAQIKPIVQSTAEQMGYSL